MICPWCGADVAPAQVCESCGSVLQGDGSVQPGIGQVPIQPSAGYPAGFAASSPYGSMSFGQASMLYGTDADPAGTTPAAVSCHPEANASVAAPYEVASTAPAAAPYGVETPASAAAPYEVAPTAPGAAPYEVAMSVPAAAPYETVPSVSATTPYEATAPVPTAVPSVVATPASAAAPYEVAPTASGAAPYEAAIPDLGATPYAAAAAPYETAAAMTHGGQAQGYPPVGQGMDASQPPAPAQPAAQVQPPVQAQPSAPYSAATAAQSMYESGAFDSYLAPKTAFVLAIIGLLLSILGATCIPGIICCIIALVLNARYEKERLINRRKASTRALGIAGIVVGLIMALALAHLFLLTDIGPNALRGGGLEAPGQAQQREQSEEAPSADAGQAFAGTWELVGMRDGDVEYTADDIAALAERDLVVQLDLAESGEAELSLFGDVTVGTWEAYSDTHATCAMRGEFAELVLSGDELAMRQSDNELVFARMAV